MSMGSTGIVFFGGSVVHVDGAGYVVVLTSSIWVVVVTLSLSTEV